MALADTMVVMNHGRIEQSGTPREVFNQPVSEFVARFMGGHNILDTPSGRIALRSDKIAVSAQGNPSSLPTLPATLLDMEFQGNYCVLSMALPQAGHEPLSVVLPEASMDLRDLRIGQALQVSWSEHDAHRLPPAPASSLSAT
jgi:putative spermidine/putrescine transport system ATP-binding protein